MKKFLIFGLQARDLETARTIIEAALGISMSPYEGMFRGGNYWRFGVDGEPNSLILQSNYIEFEKEYTCEDYHGYPYLLYVNDATATFADITLLVAGSVLISSTEV